MWATLGKWIANFLLVPLLTELATYIKVQYAAYLERKRKEKENEVAIERASTEDDQRPVERQLESTIEGERSDVKGSVIVDKLPGVKNLLLVVCLLFGVTACVTRREIKVAMWLNNFEHLSTQTNICDKVPELKEYGFYRKLNGGKIEFVSVCNPVAGEFLEIHENDFTRILNRANASDDTKRQSKDFK